MSEKLNNITRRVVKHPYETIPIDNEFYVKLDLSKFSPREQIVLDVNCEKSDHDIKHHTYPEKGDSKSRDYSVDACTRNNASCRCDQIYYIDVGDSEGIDDEHLSFDKKRIVPYVVVADDSTKFKFYRHVRLYQRITLEHGSIVVLRGFIVMNPFLDNIAPNHISLKNHKYKKDTLADSKIKEWY